MPDLNLSVRVTDERYPINVTVGDADSFTLFFNPGDPFLIRYADNLRNVDASDSGGEDEIIPITDKIEKNLDAIFGDGSARLICRYDGAEHVLLNALLGKVKEGYDDFKEKTEAISKKEKLQAVIDAKKNAAPYVAPV